MHKGKIKRVIGPVVDVDFSTKEKSAQGSAPGADDLPEIYNALSVNISGAGEAKGKHLILEVEQHLGDGLVRAVAMDSTDGLSRGMEVIDTGSPAFSTSWVRVLMGEERCVKPQGFRFIAERRSF
jgi:F-type H+/Na+-transporting ATPase subunit beta